MLFSELYSAYYNAVAAVLRRAAEHPLADEEIRQLVEKYAFSESVLSIPPALRDGRWPLLAPDGTSVLENPPSMPLTNLQKRWLKAIVLDPRIRLFGDFDWALDDVEPLFTPEDYIVFDKYADGDDYGSEDYISVFRTVLEALRKKTPLRIALKTRKGNDADCIVWAKCLEYSEKDDKFRLITSGHPYLTTINLGRIAHCEPCDVPRVITWDKKNRVRPRHVVFELSDRRNAMERVLLHFAHYEKQAEKLDGERCRVTVYYDKEDETEVLIRILSFGAAIRVTAPDYFVERIKERLRKQMSCGR